MEKTNTFSQTKNKANTQLKNESDFEHLKKWQDNPELDYYLSENHWNFHVNHILYTYLRSRYMGNEVGVYINLKLGNASAFKIDYTQIYGVMFNEAYCFSSFVLTNPVPETKIAFLESKAETLCSVELAKPIIAYNILVMTGIILCFANYQNNAMGRFLSSLSCYNHTHKFGDEFHHFEDYMKIGLECVAGIMIDGQLQSPGKLRPGYDYKGRDEYLRKTIPWYRFSSERLEKRVEKSNCKTNEIKKILNEILCKVEEQTEMIRKLEPRFIDTSSLSKQTGSSDQQDSLTPYCNDGVPLSQIQPENKQLRPKGRKPKKFEDFIHKDAPKELMPVLEEMMKGTSSREALAIILSITDVHIDKPTNKSVCERFNTVRETAYGEAVARHKGTTYGKNDFTKKPAPIPEIELTRIRNIISKRIKKLQKEVHQNQIK